MVTGTGVAWLPLEVETVNPVGRPQLRKFVVLTRQLSVRIVGGANDVSPLLDQITPFV